MTQLYINEAYINFELSALPDCAILGADGKIAFESPNVHIIGNDDCDRCNEQNKEVQELAYKLNKKQIKDETALRAYLRQLPADEDILSKIGTKHDCIACNYRDALSQ